MVIIIYIYTHIGGSPESSKSSVHVFGVPGPSLQGSIQSLPSTSSSYGRKVNVMCNSRAPGHWKPAPCWELTVGSLKKIRLQETVQNLELLPAKWWELILIEASNRLKKPDCSLCSQHWVVASTNLRSLSGLTSMIAIRTNFFFRMPWMGSPFLHKWSPTYLVPLKLALSNRGFPWPTWVCPILYGRPPARLISMGKMTINDGYPPFGQTRIEKVEYDN